jgi:hypothetical protein
MHQKTWIRRALSMCLCVAVLATYSMIALAASPKVAGELTVFGTSANGETPFVTVNGEAARSGRSVFSSSIINTPENAGAVVNLGRLGKIELAPNSAIVLSFSDNQINADLSAGKITVLGASQPVSVNTPVAGVLQLSPGESASAGEAAKQTTGGGGHSAAWWGFAAVLAGAAALIIYAATRDNDISIGGGGTVVSPVR